MPTIAKLTGPKDGIDTALSQFLGSIWNEGIACFGHDLLSLNVPNWADFAVKLDYAQSLSEEYEMDSSIRTQVVEGQQGCFSTSTQQNSSCSQPVSR